MCLNFGWTPDVVDQMDPVHLDSMMRFLEARLSGKPHRGDPGRVEVLQPGHPLYREPKDPKPAPVVEEPTAADFAAVRAGGAVRVQGPGHARRIVLAREILKNQGEI